ncbi:MAG: hypothetical protein ACW972_02455 [Promethearchaeota archaeon]|jgi:hypothetical protein
MKIRKNMKVGVSIIFLLLIFTSCISLINLPKNNNLLEENTLSLSAPNDDLMEENDDYDNASGVIPNYYPNLKIVENDDDWFKLSLNPGDIIDVYIYFNISEGNLELELYDPLNSVTYRSISNSITTDDEYISFMVDIPGDWRIKVYHYDGSTNVTYALDIFLSTGGPGDDWMEPNDDYWTAWGVGPSYYPGLMIVGDNQDWFQINLNPGDIIDVWIYFSESEGDLILELYDPFDPVLYRFQSDSPTSDEFITFSADIKGDWRIKVYHKYGNSTVYYNLDIWLYPVISGDDWMEENDDYWNAWWVEPKYHPDLTIAGFDEDWFRLFLNDGDTIDVSIRSDSSNDDEQISFQADMTGDWRIRVYQENGNFDVKYHLDIWLHVQVDDDYEENDFEMEAYDLTQYEGWWLRDISGHGIQDDEDWYEIFAEPGFEHLIINSPHFGWDIRLEIYDSNLNVIGGTNSQGNEDSDEDITSPGPDDPSGGVTSPGQNEGPMRFKLPSSGTYYIKIYGSNNGYIYDFQYLTVCLLEEQVWRSYVYGLGFQSNLDFYSIDITPGFQHLEVELLFNHTLGNIDMKLYDRWGGQITNSSSYSDNEYIDTSDLDPGFYFLLIEGSNMGNEYDLWWDDIKTDTRPDDFYELNNGAISAYDLSYMQRIPLSNINEFGLQFDEDWYKISVDLNQLRLIVIVKYDSAEGLMGFEILDSNFTKITGNFTLDDNDYIDYEVPSNGTYYIRVYGDNSGNVYNLWWATEEPDSIGMIPGYDTLILIISIIGVTAVVIKIKRSKFKHQ